MKKWIFLLTVLWSLQSKGQTYTYKQLRDSTFSTLEKEVGSDILPYFNMHPEVFINYKSWIGVSKYDVIGSGEQLTTKRFQYAGIFLDFNHPELEDYLDFIEFYIELDKNFRPIDTFELARIPDFIRHKQPCNWISADSIETYINLKGFQSDNTIIGKNLKYNSTTKKYYWYAWNNYENNGRIQYLEVIHIDPVTREVTNRHYTQTVQPCHFM